MNNPMPEIVVIAHDLRSNHNVGSILRTCDGLGVTKFVATGTTPFPRLKNDTRLPHIIDRATSQIGKTALGAEQTISVESSEINKIIKDLRSNGYSIYALEQADGSQNLRSFIPCLPFALVVGNEPNGLSDQVLELCDKVVEIPMQGNKESFNVSVACGIALWQLTS